MSDNLKVDFDEDLKLNHILNHRFRKKETEKNRSILRTIEGVYKKIYNLTTITDEIKFYTFIEGHPLFKELD